MGIKIGAPEKEIIYLPKTDKVKIKSVEVEISKREVVVPVYVEKEVVVPKYVEKEVLVPQLDALNSAIQKLQDQIHAMATRMQGLVKIQPTIKEVPITVPKIVEKEVVVNRLKYVDKICPVIVEREVVVPKIHYVDTDVPRIIKHDVDLPVLKKKEVEVLDVRLKDVIVDRPILREKVVYIDKIVVKPDAEG